MTGKKLYTIGTLLIFLTSCTWQPFREDEISFPSRWANFYDNLTSTDTIILKNQFESEIILVKDSTYNFVHNIKGYFINQRAYNYRETSFVSEDKKLSPVQFLVSINRYPDKNENSILIELDNRYFEATSFRDLKLKKVLKFRDTIFSNVYEINSYDDSSNSKVYIDTVGHLKGFTINAGVNWKVID